MVRMRFALVAAMLAACGSNEPGVYTPSQAADPESDEDFEARQVGAQPETGERVDQDEKPLAATGTRTEFAEKVPDSAFKNSTGAEVNLATATNEEGAVVVFYRGHWCRQCRKQLKELEDIRTRVEGKKFRIYAVSTDDPQTSNDLRSRLGLGYELLSDKAGLSIEAWGVYTRVHNLARPAVFVIAPGGQIAYRYVSDSPADRPSPETILAEIDKIQLPEE